MLFRPSTGAVASPWNVQCCDFRGDSCPHHLEAWISGPPRDSRSQSYSFFWGVGGAVLSLRCAGLSLVVASRGYSLLWCVGFSSHGFSCC